MGYLHSLKVPPHKIFINYKRNSFTVEKSSRQHFQGAKLTSLALVTGQSEVVCCLMGCMRTHHHFYDIPAKDTEPKFDHNETSDKSKLKDTLQNN